jgi:hypothetical protein
VTKPLSQRYNPAVFGYTVRVKEEASLAAYAQKQLFDFVLERVEDTASENSLKLPQAFGRWFAGMYFDKPQKFSISDGSGDGKVDLFFETTDGQSVSHFVLNTKFTEKYNAAAPVAFYDEITRFWQAFHNAANRDAYLSVVRPELKPKYRKLFDYYDAGNAELFFVTNHRRNESQFEAVKATGVRIFHLDELLQFTLDCVCSTGPQSLVYNVKENSNNASEIVWFNSHFKLQGTVPSSDFTVNVTNQTITFGPSTLAVPNAVITFTSKANCASTSFNTSTNEWDTFIPLAYATHADEIFSAGLAYMLPSNFPQNVNNVAWNATFTSTAPSLQFQFQYGAANYLSQNNKGDVFPLTGGGQPDYNVMMIDPVHNAPTCNGYNGGDHAGAPENPQVKGLVTGGGSGGGGSNWTGSWSSTPTYICAAP